MSVSIKPFCRKERIAKNGTAIVQLRVTINRKSRYVSTGIRVSESDWDFENQAPKTDNQALNCQIYEQIESLRKQAKRLEALDIKVTLDNLLGSKKLPIGCTVGEYMVQVIEQMKSAGRFSSAARCKVILAQLQRLHLAGVRFEDVTLDYILKYESALIGWGNKPNSIATKISVLKAIYNRALANRLFVCAENPFAKYNIGKLREQTQKRAIRKEDVMALMEAPLPETHSPYTELARDLFLFSYFSAGINFKDVALLRCCDLVNGRIHYRRQKTGKEMNCQLMPQTQSIVSKYITANKSGADYIFPILDRAIHKTEIQIANRLNKVLRHINRELKNWGKTLGLPTKLTTYVARHTFATVLKRSGVNIAIISELLGHSDLSTTQIYLDSFDNEQIAEAMKNLV